MHGQQNIKFSIHLFHGLEKDKFSCISLIIYLFLFIYPTVQVKNMSKPQDMKHRIMDLLAKINQKACGRNG